MKYATFLLALISLVVSGCSGKDPEPINYGKDNCTFCQMLITDHRFGSELITPKGKVFKFDSIECLVGYCQMPGNYDDKESAVFVTSMIEPDKLFDARTGMFVVSKEINSPMGANLAVFRSHEKAIATVKDKNAVHYNWTKLLKELK